MVQGIDFSDNHLSGEIPVSIGDCSSLLVLALPGYSFNGPIPNTLANLKGMEFIDLSSNNLPRNSNLCGGVPGLELLICTVVPEKYSGKSRVRLIIGLVAGFTVFGLLSGLFLFLLSMTKSGNRKSNNAAVSFEEYGLGGVSTKGDVYSFGILVLEVFTRKKPTDEMFTWDFNVQNWVIISCAKLGYHILCKKIMSHSSNLMAKNNPTLPMLLPGKLSILGKELKISRFLSSSPPSATFFAFSLTILSISDCPTVGNTTRRMIRSTLSLHLLLWGLYHCNRRRFL
ncbi:hypothetical protein GIB67_013595 [Kingdonia uniflora]|uniref:Uncharacterized protein n=1 Tax=Kingdonia uniflora TaxID=39325 RepID=A0A7J7KV33_9MAGN|nr:hypothetical protein GIB67_013595 [Kingdonia uniflora]